MNDVALQRQSIYVQAIPMYFRSDTAIEQFLRDHGDEVDEITGNHISILLSKTVVLYDTKGIVETLDATTEARFPGLNIDDLPCLWIEDGLGQTEILKLPHSSEEIKQVLRILADAARKTKDAAKIVSIIRAKTSNDIVERSSFLNEIRKGMQMSKPNERLIALVCGIIFVTCIFIVAIFLPNPTAFQYTIFRIILSLAAAGFVSMTPGFIDARVGTSIRAGGALAVFVVVFFFAPAALHAGN